MAAKAAGATVALSWVVRVAFDKLVRSEVNGAESDVLNLLALGISMDAPVYGTSAGGEVRRLEKLELAAGRFAQGAARFEFDDGRAPFTDLQVRIAELPPAIRGAVTAPLPE